MKFSILFIKVSTSKKKTYINIVFTHVYTILFMVSL